MQSKWRALPGTRFGSEIVGLQPGAISPRQREEIREAHRRGRGLICFSFDRLLEADELHALTAVFGENEFAPGKIYGIGPAGARGAGERAGRPARWRRCARAATTPTWPTIGNLNPQSLETRPVDDKFYGEWEWHSDMSYLAVPPTFSLLHARRIPTEGGDTGFCSQVLAAQQLPEPLRQRIGGLKIKHDSTYSSNGQLRPGMTAPASPIEAIGHAHPIIRRIPDTELQALFLGRRTNAYVVGLPARGERAVARSALGARRPAAVLLPAPLAGRAGGGVGQPDAAAQTLPDGQHRRSLHVAHPNPWPRRSWQPYDLAAQPHNLARSIHRTWLNLT